MKVTVPGARESTAQSYKPSRGVLTLTDACAADGTSS